MYVIHNNSKYGYPQYWHTQVPQEPSVDTYCWFPSARDLSFLSLSSRLPSSGSSVYVSSPSRFSSSIPASRFCGRQDSEKHNLNLGLIESKQPLLNIHTLIDQNLNIILEYYYQIRVKHYYYCGAVFFSIIYFSLYCMSEFTSVTPEYIVDLFPGQVLSPMVTAHVCTKLDRRVCQSPETLQRGIIQFIRKIYFCVYT